MIAWVSIPKRAWIASSRREARAPKRLHTHRTFESEQVELNEKAQKRRRAVLLQSPLTDSNRRPPLYEEGLWVKRFCIAWSWWSGWLVVLSGAHLSIASCWLEDQVGWEPRFRWRISLRAVRRPGGSWRLPERRVGRG